MSFPNIFVLQFGVNNQYVRYVKENVANHGFLQVRAGSVVDPCSKFTVERAKSTADGSLVHIRCIYNNRYLVRQSSTSTWILANAEEPEEDRSKWSCTLFSPMFNVSAYRFLHVQLQLYLEHVAEPSTNTQCLRASAGIAQSRAYRIFDREALFIMPRYVSFKGDNGRYLSVRSVSGQDLQFALGDKGDPSCWFEVITTNDGSIRLRSVQFNTFWRRVPTGSDANLIWVDGGEFTSGNMFWAIKVDDNTIAIRNNLNQRFCERVITGDRRDRLRASSDGISQTSRLVLEEAVLSRRVDNVIYRLMDSRIYNERALIMASNEAVNETEDEHDMQLHFSYSESTSSTWNASVSTSLGVTANFRAGIPFLIRKEISVSVEVSGGYEWGKTVEQTTEVSTTYDVTVPPNSKVIVRLLATEASFDVPFSYVQRDTLFDGRVVVSESDGGIFEGVNSYNFRYEIKKQKLDSTGLMAQAETTTQIIEPKTKIPRSAL